MGGVFVARCSYHALRCESEICCFMGCRHRSAALALVGFIWRSMVPSGIERESYAMILNHCSIGGSNSAGRNQGRHILRVLSRTIALRFDRTQATASTRFRSSLRSNILHLARLEFTIGIVACLLSGGSLYPLSRHVIRSSLKCKRLFQSGAVCHGRFPRQFSGVPMATQSGSSWKASADRASSIWRRATVFRIRGKGSSG